MRQIILFFVATVVCASQGETVEEAYARLTAYRSVWETNAWAYVQTVPVVTNDALAEANGRWFVDFLQYPDVTDTNRLDEIFRARNYAVWHYGDVIGILDNTNAWYAVAAYISHLKDVADPRWIDESYDVVIDVDSYGVETVTNVNPLLDFSVYRKRCFDEFCLAHTNLITEGELMNAFVREWSELVNKNVKRERVLKNAMREAKRTIRETFWWFGAENMSEAEKSICRSNIVERARLSQEEADSIFVEKFRFIPIK